MLRMYAAKRHVVVGDAVGEELIPTSGFLPGCPAATDWMALATWPWLLKVRAIPRAVARGWVDDLTAYLSGTRAQVLTLAPAAMEAVMHMEAEGGYMVNRTKSGVVATNPALLRRVLEQLAPLRLTPPAAITDLGVVQGN